jgi:hypothetical protein
MNIHVIPAEPANTPSRIEQRLAVLRQEYESGQMQLRALDQRKQELQNTMLRISGAITVMEELLAEEKGNRAES